MGICGNQYVPFLTKDFYHTFLKSKNIGREKFIHKKSLSTQLKFCIKLNSIKLINCYVKKKLWASQMKKWINATSIFFIFWKVCYILSLLESFLALLCSVLPCGAWNSQPPQCVHLNNSISHYFKSRGVLKAELSLEAMFFSAWDKSRVK